MMNMVYGRIISYLVKEMFDFTVSKMLLSTQSQKYKCTCSAIILKFRILHYFLKS